MSEKVPPTTTSADGGSTPEVTSKSEGNSSTKLTTSTATIESDAILTALTINQQLANHLAGQTSQSTAASSNSTHASVATATAAGGIKPPSKRKRSSIDQKAILSMKTQHQSLEVKKIGFIGAGNMARAIAEGWINSGQVKAANITATVRSVYSHNLKPMKALGVNVSLLNRDVIGQCDMIVIAVKPYQVLEVMQEMHQMFKNSGSQTPKTLRPLVVSVAASVPLAEIEKKAEISWNIGGSAITGHLPIIRCIPNIACSVQSGVTVFARGRFCNEEDIKPFVTLFSALGPCEEVEEKYMEAFVGLTGSGLAYVEMALEAMADGGVLAGIPFAISLRMAAHTMIGAANLILKKNLHPAQVKNAVASPGGTTIQGILALEAGGMRGAMINAVKAAVDKARQL